MSALTSKLASLLEQALADAGTSLLAELEAETGKLSAQSSRWVRDAQAAAQKLLTGDATQKKLGLTALENIGLAVEGDGLAAAIRLQRATIAKAEQASRVFVTLLETVVRLVA